MKNRKLFGTIIGIIIYGLCIIFFSYAFYSWRSDNTIVNLNIQDATFEFEKGPDVDVYNIGPVMDYNDGVSTTFSITNSVDITRKLNLSLDITEISDNLKNETFKYILLRDNNEDENFITVIKEGNFEDFEIGTNTILENYTIDSNSTYNYKFIVYIDGNEKNDVSMINNTLKSSLVISEQTYNLTLDAGGGTVNTTVVDIVKGSPYGELPMPERTGYTFNGWYTSEEGGEQITSDTIVTSTEAHTAYARWTANTYNITFNPNEGEVTITSMTVTYDEEYGTLPVPTRTGYNFLGWYTALEGGTKVTDTSTVKVTVDTTLYAHWELGIINITFDPNGGSVDTTTMDVIYGESYGDLPTPTRTGYTFNGWYTESSGGSKIESTTTVTVKEAQTLYAQWTINTYTVSYYNGTTLINTSSHTYGTAKNLTTWANLGASVTNSSVGWTFAGWSTANNNTTRTYSNGQSVNNLTETAGGNVILYAVYSRTITFKHGASAASSSTATQYWNPAGTTNGTHVGSVISPALTAITNWTASGFRNDTSAGAKEYDANASIYPASGEAATLYGAYTRSITFYSGASKGTNHGTRTQYLNSNSNTVSAITSYTPTTITNWSALGFRADTTASSQSYGSNTSISPAYTTGNTMYAVYSRTLTISYNGNSNTGGSTSNTTKTVYLNTNSTKTSSQAVTLAANGFSRTGHTFSKWAEASASGTQYGASTSYTPSVAYNASTFGVTMFAVWTANTYTVSFNANGGTTGTSSKTVTYGSTYGTLPTPTRANYVFNGWYTATSGGTKITSSSTVTITAAQTLYAQWSLTAAQTIINKYNANTATTVYELGDSANPAVKLNTTQLISLDTNGNYRYYGANPNNYVKFNDELWRIISVETVYSNTSDTTGEKRIKIIKSNILTDDNGLIEYSLDSSASNIQSGKGINAWDKADLKTELNTLYYNSTSGTCYIGQNNQSTTCSFVNTGLDATARTLIDNAVYYLSGIDDTPNLSPNDYYSYERGTNVVSCSSSSCGGARTTRWVGMVGLFYISDYLYATDLSVCKKDFFNFGYNSDYTCSNNDWLHDSNASQWSMTQYTFNYTGLFWVMKGGWPGAGAAYTVLSVRPTVYLKANVKITGGSGTSSSPYTLSL